MFHVIFKNGYAEMPDLFSCRVSCVLLIYVPSGSPFPEPLLRTLPPLKPTAKQTFNSS